jgi:uncharacterized protein YggE
MRRVLVLGAMFVGAVLGRAAIAEEDRPVPTITVGGEGEVQVAPDQVTVTVGVTTEAKTAAEALKANTERMNELFKTLKAHDIAEKHMQTSNFNVSPQHVYDRDGKPPKLIGYTVSNQVTIKVLEVSRLGAILDAVVAAGGNQVQGVSFSVANPMPHLDQARRKAVADARHRAELYAAEAQVKLGKPLHITEQTAVAPPRPMYAQAMRAEAGGPVPIAAGEHTISAQVTITFEIAQ